MHQTSNKVILSALIIINYVFVTAASSADTKTSNDFVGSTRDSYVNAYRTTQALNLNTKSGKVNRDADYYPFGTADDYNTSPVFYQQQNQDYGPPKIEYGPPKVEYGPPKPEYGSPKPEYGPPVKDYAPANQLYGPAPTYYHYVQPVSDNSYGTPYSMILPGLLDKLKFKLNLFTIGKIILKLVIFKKIVSLLGILCLLMFIPTLKHIKEPEHGDNHDDDDDDDGMMLRSLKDKTDNDINNMSANIFSSIYIFSKKYEKQNQTSNSSKKCGSIYCKSQVFLKYLDKKYSYKKLASAYLAEESDESKN